jgi:hypothetical protein
MWPIDSPVPVSGFTPSIEQEKKEEHYTFSPWKNLFPTKLRASKPYLLRNRLREWKGWWEIGQCCYVRCRRGGLGLAPSVQLFLWLNVMR